jgi:hypothetical protein
MSDINSVQSEDGFTITSNTQTKEQLEEQFSEPEEAAGEGEGKPATPEASAQTPASPNGEEKAEEGKNKWSRRSSKARVEQAVLEKNRANARADEIEVKWKQTQAELERFRSIKPPEAKPEPVAAKPQEDGRPNQADFNDWDKYQEALVDWKIEVKERAAKQDHERQLMVQHQETLFSDWQKRAAEALKADPTLDSKISPEVVRLIPTEPLDLSKKLTNEQLLGVYFIQEKSGLDLMKHLSENPTELQRLSTLPQGSLLLELGRMDGRLSAATLRDTAPAQTTISRASAPVRPVTAAPPSASDPDELPDPKLDPVAWGKKREALEDRRRRA